MMEVQKIFWRLHVGPKMTCKQRLEVGEVEVEVMIYNSTIHGAMLHERWVSENEWDKHEPAVPGLSEAVVCDADPAKSAGIAVEVTCNPPTR